MAVVCPFRYKGILCSPPRTTILVIFIFVIVISMLIPLTVDMLFYDFNTKSIGNEFPLSGRELRQYSDTH